MKRFFAILLSLVIAAAGAATVISPRSAAASAVEGSVDGLHYKLSLDSIKDYEVGAQREGGLAYNGSFYLYAPGRSGRLFKSFDGLNWTQIEGKVRIDDQSSFQWNVDLVRKLIWDGKQFILLLTDYYITSTDGLTWEKHVVPASNGHIFRAFDLLFTGDRYLFTGYDYDPGESDHQMDYNGGKLDFGAHTVRIVSSPDLKTFTDANTAGIPKDIFGTERYMESLGYNGSVYVATGGASSSSTDGISWTGNQDGPGDGRIIWDGSKFWIAYNSEILNSTDGVHWSDAYEIQHPTWHQETQTFDDDGIPLYLKAIDYDGTQYVASGYRLDAKSEKDLILLCSPNGTDWHEVVIPGGDTDVTGIYATKHGMIVTGNKIWNIGTHDIDQPSEWAKPLLTEASDDGLVLKKLLSFYQDNVTREETAELTIRLYEALTGKQEMSGSGSPFHDTDNASVAAAYRLGIVSGVGDGRFAPDASVTRQDLSVMMYKTLQAAGIELSSGSGGWSQPYVDQSEIASYAVEPMHFLNAKSIIGGRDGNRLAPRGNTTREEAVVLMLRAFNQFNSGKKAPPSADETDDNPVIQMPQPTEDIPVSEQLDAHVTGMNYEIDGLPFELGPDNWSVDYNGYLYVPAKTFMEKLGGSVQWEQQEGALSFTAGPVDYSAEMTKPAGEVKRLPRASILFTAKNRPVKVRINGKDQTMPEWLTTLEVEGHLYVPLDTLLQGLGMTAVYDGSGDTDVERISHPHTTTITYKAKADGGIQTSDLQARVHEGDTVLLRTDDPNMAPNFEWTDANGHTSLLADGSLNGIFSAQKAPAGLILKADGEGELWLTLRPPQKPAFGQTVYLQVSK